MCFFNIYFNFTLHNSFCISGNQTYQSEYQVQNIKKETEMSAIFKLKYFCPNCFSCKALTTCREHLFRCHLAPIHCPRCWCEFEAERDLENHLQAEDICHKRNSGDPPRGITAEQARVLRSRKKSPVAQSEEQRWMEIYQLLFPNEPCPDSPCMISSIHSQVVLFMT